MIWVSFFSLIMSFICVYVPVFVAVCAHKEARRGPEEVSSSILLYFIVVRQGLSLNLEFAVSVIIISITLIILINKYFN